MVNVILKNMPPYSTKKIDLNMFKEIVNNMV